ncbi:hypothetical protein Nmel_015662 [Mimus melanotis]
MDLLCSWLGHARHQRDACLGIAMPVKCPRACASVSHTPPSPCVPGTNVSPLCSRLQVNRMLWHGKPWRSMCKGLVLGTLLTSFMLLLYSYAVPPLQVSVTE